MVMLETSTRSFDLIAMKLTMSDVHVPAVLGQNDRGPYWRIRDVHLRTGARRQPGSASCRTTLSERVTIPLAKAAISLIVELLIVMGNPLLLLTYIDHSAIAPR